MRLSYTMKVSTKADEAQSLGESSTDDEVREQTTLQFGLASGGDAAAVAGDADAQAGPMVDRP